MRPLPLSSILAVALFVTAASSIAWGKRTGDATPPSQGKVTASAPATQPAQAAQQPAADAWSASDFVDANPYPDAAATAAAASGIGVGFSDFTPVTGFGTRFATGFGPTAGALPVPAGIFIGPVQATDYVPRLDLPRNTVWNGSLSAGVANSLDGVPLGPQNFPSIAGGGGTHPAAVFGIPASPRRFTHPAPPQGLRPGPPQGLRPAPRHSTASPSSKR
jgi:hypothetical protein